jgi:hypothetical protein
VLQLLAGGKQPVRGVGQKGTIFFIPFFFLLDDSVLGSTFEVSAVASAGAGVLLPAVDCVDSVAAVPLWPAGVPACVAVVGSNVSGVAADRLLGDDSGLPAGGSELDAAVEEVSGDVALPDPGASII